MPLGGRKASIRPDALSRQGRDYIITFLMMPVSSQCLLHVQETSVRSQSELVVVSLLLKYG